MESPRSTPCVPGATARSARSWPAQNPRPAPPITSTRAPCPRRLCKAARTSSCMRTLKLLSLSGRFRVRRAMPPSIENRMVSYDESFFVIGELQRGSEGTSLAAQDETRIHLPGLERNVVRHDGAARFDLGPAGGANPGPARERQLEPGPLGCGEHRDVRG